MESSSTSSTDGLLGGEQHTRWSGRLIGQMAALMLVNAMADTAIRAPLFVLPQMLDHFGTDQAAWLSSSAMLAGAMWAPLVGKTADVYGKRRVLVMTLLVACAGALVCLVAPNIWVFVLGRMLQGAAVASVFLTVAIIRDVCVPRIAMPVVGIVTTGSGVLGIGSPFLFEMLAAEFGFQIVFVASAMSATAAAVCVRGLIPRSTIKTAGRIDVAGAVLLGGGLAAVLSYISLGSELGWFSVGPLALLAAGTATLARWFLVSSRKPEPVIDIRNLGRPLVLTLLVVVLGTGASQSIDQLTGIIIEVSPDQQLGYGLAAPGALGLLFGVPTIGIMAGGPLAGVLATRIGPAATLAAGLAVGTVGTIGMFVGASHLYPAVFFCFLLNLATAALWTSGFNMAATLAPAERQGVVAAMVMVMIASGSVVLRFVGAAVLSSTDMVVDGSTVNSATGVYSYLAIAAAAFVVAAVPAVMLVRRQRLVHRTPSPA